MPVTYELETPTGAKYDVEFDSEPTEEMMNAALRDITASESDTGQGMLSSMAGATARGAAGLAPAVAQGVGALIPGETGRDIRTLGKLLQEDVETMLPVNPAYQDTMPVKGAAAVGQGLAFLGGALASGGSSLPVLGVGGLAGAAGGADVADQYGLEGWRRGVATVGAGAAEVVSERLFGLGSPRFLKGAGRPLIEGAKAVAGEAVEEPIAGVLGDLSTNAALLGTDNPLLNPLDPAKRGEEALYGAIGAGPFGGVAALNARRLRGSKLFATVDGQVTPLPDDVTEKEVEQMGLKPQDVAVVPQGKAQEMMDAILRARTEGEKTNVASVLTEAARTPSVFDAPPPTAEEIAALDETPEPEEVIPNEEERQILQGGPEVTPDPLVPETTNPAAEGSAPGGVGDLGASTEGPATGSSAPAVSSEQVPGETPVVNTEVTPPELTSFEDFEARLREDSTSKADARRSEAKAAIEALVASGEIEQNGNRIRGLTERGRSAVSDMMAAAGQTGIPTNARSLYLQAVKKALSEKKPVRAESIDQLQKEADQTASVLGVQPTQLLPQGYVREGDLFVFKPTTVQDLATSNVAAKRNVDPAAFRAMAKENIRPAPESIAPAQRPANPIPAGMAAAHVARAHNLGAGQVDVVNRPEMVARGWLDPKTGRPVINVPWIRNADEVSEVLYHEITHRAEEDPAMRPDIDAFMATLTPAEIDRLNARLARMKYALNEFPTERAAIAISEAANSFRGKSGWAKLVQRVKTWWKELTGQTLNKKDAEAIAARIVTRAVAQLRSGQPMVRGRVSGNVRRSAVDPRDADGNVTPLPQRFNPASDDIRYSRPEPRSPEEKEIRDSAPDIARAAQTVYDEWDQDGDGHSEELGTGGICDLIAQEISSILGGKGFNIVEGGQEGDDHAYIFAEKNGKVFAVDIAPNTYEIGGGYSWRKKPNVVFTAEHVDVGEVEYEDVFGEPYSPEDTQFSRPEPDAPLPLTGPVEGDTRPMAQVMGREGTSPVVPSSQARVLPVIRRNFFDSTAGVSDDNTRKAMDIITTMMGRVTGPELAQRVRGSVDPVDQNIAMGVLRQEVDAYGLAMLATGDKTVFELMQRYATTDWFIGTREDGTAYTYRDVAQELAGNSRLPGSPAAVARDTVNISMHEANSSVLGEEAYTDIRNTVDSTKLDEGEVAEVKKKKVTKDKTLEDKVEELVEKKRPKKSEAERLLDTLAKSQSDTQTNTKPKINIILDIYRRALKSPLTDENLRKWLTSKLSAADVTAPILDPLTTAIITERRNRRAVSTAKTGEALATGRRGSLKELERQLAEAPAPLQRSPVWRRRIILDYFMQTGLSKPNAEALARVYENEFAERLQQATQRAVERLVNSQTPWARRNKAAPKKRQDRISKEVKKLLEAVRLGLTNPYNLWDAEMAKKNGWNGFTPEQHAELEAMDSKLNSVTLPANEKAQLLLRINRMIVAAKLPPTLANTILTSYVASALSGLSTINVQFSAHVGGIMRAISTIVADPTMQAFREASKTVWKETKFAWKTGAYRNEVLDTLRGHERPLELMFNDGLKAMKSKDPMTRAKGLVKVVTGSQEYVMRALSSIDQGYITAAEEFSGIIFTKDILRQLGMTRKESNMVIEELLRQKDAFYQRLIALGVTPMQASADATDVFMRFLYETIADRSNASLDGLNSVELAEDMLRGTRLDAEGQTGRVSSAEGIGPMDEGILRLPVSALVEAISKYTGQGGSLGLAMRGIFGFVSIPMRTAAWYAGYSPYGFIRYGIHKFQSERGHKSPYAQSYGARAQVRQRLREATAGSVAMLVLALLATPTADDDDEKENAFFVTGGGPDDLVLREAWLRRFKPYSIVVKAGGKYHAFNYGRTFEAVGWAATLAGTIDDVHARRKAREARGTELDYLDAAAGNLLGNMVERSSFKGMMKFAEIFSRAKEGGTDLRLASQMAFMTSSLVPWKSAMNSVQRLYADPVDNDTIAGSILAATPVAGPIIGRTRINVLGDPAGDVSPGGRAFTLGYPSFGAPQGGKAYDLILHHGRGPSVYHRNQFSKTFQTDDTDALFYDFTYRRGRKIKTALADNYDRLKDVDSETFAAFLERLSRSVNEQVAAEMKLQRTAKK